MTKLDAYEKEILDAFDQGKLHTIKNKTKELNRLRAAARNTIKKDARINIRLTRRDILAIKSRAVAEGIPYQTLASSVLHKFINGMLLSRA